METQLMMISLFGWDRTSDRISPKEYLKHLHIFFSIWTLRENGKIFLSLGTSLPRRFKVTLSDKKVRGFIKRSSAFFSSRVCLTATPRLHLVPPIGL